MIPFTRRYGATYYRTSENETSGNAFPAFIRRFSYPQTRRTSWGMRVVQEVVYHKALPKFSDRPEPEGGPNAPPRPLDRHVERSSAAGND